MIDIAPGAHAATFLQDSSPSMDGWFSCEFPRQIYTITPEIYRVLLPRLITSSTNGYDGSLMNSLQSMSQWKDFFNNPQGGTLGLLNAIQVSNTASPSGEQLVDLAMQNIGSLAGYPFAPYLSDGIGRRPTIWIGAICMLAGAALQTACQNINQFIGAR